MQRAMRPGGSIGLAALLLAVVCGCEDAAFPTPRADRELVQKIRSGAGGGAGAAEAAPTGTGWGTLRGQFVLDGALPALADIPAGGQDVAVCGAVAPNQSLVVDSGTQGIANVVLFARKVSRTFQEEGAPPPEPLVFDQKACLFLTHVAATRVGAPIKVKNSDPVSHNTNIAPPGGAAINPLLAANAEIEYAFTKPLSAPTAVSCNIHPWMKAYLIARPDNYVAVSDAQGKFEIPNLPAGEKIEFQVWHERAGGKGGPLAAKPEWRGGRFTLTIPADGVEDLQAIRLPVAAFQ
jgi:hypothetical protein